MTENEEQKTLVRFVTNSERSSFACERRWGFAYLDGLSAFDAPAPLRFGSLVHACLAAWYESDMTMPIEEINSEVIQPWLDARFEYTEKLDDGGEKFAENEAEANTAEGMMGGYLDKWGDHDRERWEILAVEFPWARWLPTKPGSASRLHDYATVDGHKVRRYWAAAGMVDLLIREKDTGRVMKVEHKTTMETSFDSYFQKLDFDPQIRQYAWGLREPIPEFAPHLGDGVKIDGIIYNALRKKVPREPPVLTKCGACKHPQNKHTDAGCEGTKSCECKCWKAGGLSKAAIDTTKEMYESAVRRHDLNMDDYREVIDRLDCEFFGRKEYLLTERDLVDFERDLVWFARDLVKASKPGRYHPRQVQVCHGIVSAGCQFESLCMEDGAEARQSFTVRNIRHAELSGDLAEPNVLKEEPRRSLPVIQSVSARSDGKTLSELIESDPLDDVGTFSAKSDSDPFEEW